MEIGKKLKAARMKSGIMDGYQIKTMSFWGTDKVVLIFKKGLKGSFL